MSWIWIEERTEIVIVAGDLIIWREIVRTKE